MPSHSREEWVHVAIDELRSLAVQSLMDQGHSASDAAGIAEVLLYADLRGNDQGVVKLAGAGLPRGDNASNIAILNRTPVSALIDGGANAGILVLRAGADVAAEIASAIGVAIVGTRNSINSSGCLGFYASQLADRGFVSLVFAGSRPTVAPHGSFEATLGTNPMAVGIPVSGGSPIVLDFATAAITWYGLAAAALAGNLIPEGFAYDESGRETTDPERAMNGAIKSFGNSHKSGGLSVMIELLTGALVGAVSPTTGQRSSGGHLVVAFNPALIAPPDMLTAGLNAALQRIKAANPLPGLPPVLLPGERGNEVARQSIESGRIAVSRSVYQALRGGK